ncbi:MAG: hypothetical protein BWY74_03946 [Firmicutes bacterium ADurb.Bin419]|jgi:hypothetical protein|nr:MAG: hypothetical protein BWY74_03946 [Firmicutes bacterium ADurb.Bin419]
MPLLEEIQKETVDSNSDLGALPPILKRTPMCSGGWSE